MGSRHADSIELDDDRQQVRHGGRWVPLRSRTFAVLQYLADRRGQVVRKDDILAALWPETEVGEQVLTVCISELRKALQDSRLQPRSIETIPQTGYRLLATVRSGRHEAGPRRGPAPAASSDRFLLDPVFVGRAEEQAQLQRSFLRCLSGMRQLVLIGGEAGAGKTALVERFLASITRDARREPARVARGQCVARHGAGEAFLPLFEALERLARQPHGDGEVAPILRQHAPWWLSQLPSLATPRDLERAGAESAGAPRERVLRQLAAAVEALAARQPLALLLEDLHWSDTSTLEFIELLSRRDEPARLIVLATHRPMEAPDTARRLRELTLAAESHGRGAELSLTPLAIADVVDYLEAQFPGILAGAGEVAVRHVARALHRHSHGRPLLLVAAAAQLRAVGSIAEERGRWRFRGELAEIEAQVPQGLRQMIEAQLETLGPTEAEILEGAAAIGLEFSAPLVAAALQAEPARVVDVSERLASRQMFIERGDGQRSPERAGTPASYHFLHELYREALYERIGRPLRRRLHQRIGEQLLATYGEHAAENAGQLAAHFALADDHARALEHHAQAGANGLARGAFREAAQHLEAALEQLGRLPRPERRGPREIHLLAMLGLARMNYEGFAAPTVEHVFGRAHALSRRADTTPELFTVIEGLHTFYAVRGDLRRAYEHAQRLARIAAQTRDPAQLLEGDHVLGSSLMRRGELAAATTHLDAVVAACEHVAPQLARMYSGHDPRACALGHLSVTTWLAGSPDRAREHGEQAIAWARHIAHPFSLALAQCYAGITLVLRREAAAALALADDMMAVATENDLPFWQSTATSMRGAALAEIGETEEGLALARQGAQAYHAAGGGQIEMVWLVASCCEKAGEIEEGLAAVAHGHALLRAHGERHLAPELHRLEGAMRLARDPRDRRGRAEACFRAALRLARRTRSRSFALRAAVSLARLEQRRGRHDEARRLVRAARAGIDDGFTTADLLDAQAILEL